MDSFTTNAKSKERLSFTYQNLGNVTDFLKELNLQQYVTAFIDEGFESLPAIREITEEDLIALNVKRGHRRVIQRGIATLNGIPKNQPLIVIAPASSFTLCSAYTNSGYGSMGSPRHISSTAQKYDSSNSSQYASNPQHTHHDLIIDPQSETQPSNNDTASKNMVSAIEGSRSSFSSNDDDENDADGNMDLPIKRKYRRHPKPDKNAPIKPPSAYIMFSNDARAQLKDHNMSFVEIAKLVGDQWKNLNVNLKHQYERTAMRAKDEYIDALNAYRQTNEYKNYQTYLNNFKSEQDATNRKIARLRKK
ncbi:high mobility group box domain-containing protein, partial [Thamnidium elegans]